uniref:Ferritin n=1 Tax=Ruditapes decussatus TaxID=104385 RepID=A0A067XHZ5_9BIVA|nr:ferritin 3 [Ruditapes decussatus]
MQANRQATFSFLFFLGSLLVSMVIVPEVLEVSGAKPSKLSQKDDKSVSVVSQNLEDLVLASINKRLLNDLMGASYTFLYMSAYFGRADIALPGFSKYFRQLSERELGNANFLMSYINKRGGYVEFRSIEAPSKQKWLDGLDAMYSALEIEKNLNDRILGLQRKASRHEDPHMTHIIEDRYVDPQVEIIKEISDHIANLSKMMGENYGLGEYLFDKEL